MPEEAELSPEQQRLAIAFHEFIQKMNGLEAKRLEAVKRIIARVEKEKIEELLKTFQ